MSSPTPESIQSLILQTLSTSNTIPDSRELSIDGQTLNTSEDQNAIRGVLDSLQRKEMVEYKQITATSFTLTEEGQLINEKGSHEIRVWQVLPVKGQGEPITVPDLQKLVGADVAKIGQSNAFKKKWISKDGPGFVRAVEQPPKDETAEQLKEISSTGNLKIAGSENAIKELQKRKLILPKKHIHYSVTKGPQFSTEVKQLETDLTVEMLQSGAWKESSFKTYNFAAAGQPTDGGALHPLLKVREEFRNIFFDMGFTEMPTNQFVESAFWNFDAMFVPQQHPAREVQDTFYVKSPVKALQPDPEYYERVRKIHEEGGYGSIGYRAPFSREESEKLLLRTHTTAVSTAMLYELANQPGGFKPAKMYSIDRVFRNEAMDATHLAEFHQVEGVVADYNITLGHLIAFMQEFFAKTGNHKLRFKPAYNPYTEPSMEVFSWHEGLGKWIEIANSGIFRPEMLEPMGLPKGVRVLGWGMSLERPTMIKYKIGDIRTLVGHKTDLDQVKKRAAVRLEKGDD
ncbi:phenylalanine-tRNA ligase, alpha subunit [Kwoniella pini CBS 10737]|uniref:Phenylalanine--tRNA ligase alpha subunit n=1 Tax=Kwoniella pini CBS 10737 TaxID=1296096 RepID=A0A1B9HUT4_9TREE|nr:phenylalanine-tRNA ligase, alpha subunit [Kwoniella pini CBS 10737]OCF47030.1 phenylalanine-tRNA ligase, alpha subunit [Kwoniella pini CBS 10737]